MATNVSTSHVINMDSAAVGRGFPEVKNRKLKEQAIAFYSQHNVTQTLEKLLNELFLVAPQDVYGYMVGYYIIIY